MASDYSEITVTNHLLESKLFAMGARFNMANLNQPQVIASLSEPSPAKQRGNRQKKFPRGTGTVELIIVMILITLTLVYGWQQRAEHMLTSETGLGYFLGIIGSLMMLLLLLYPLRKRMKALRFLGNVRIWFRVHMIFGLVGPALIILHSNFSLGSLNGSIAFISMLIVAISGLVGRFFYGRIHRGLYGHRTSVREYLSDAERFKSAFNLDYAHASDTIDELRQYEARRLAPYSSLWQGMVRACSSPIMRNRLRHRVMLHLSKSQDSTTRRKFERNLKRYLSALARAEAFALYERLFALWHLLHLPLFIILVLAALTHVVAVHHY